MKSSPIINFIDTSDESLNVLFKEMHKYSTLTPERERVLAEKASHDAKAREELIMCNLPFAVHVANKWASDRMPLRDLLGPAIEGLIQGVDSYDPKSGNRVLSYVKWKIEACVQAYSECMRSGMALSHRHCNLLTSLRSARNRLEQELGYSINDQALAILVADETGRDVDDLVCIMRAERFDTFDGNNSGSNFYGDDDIPTWQERIADDNDVERFFLDKEMNVLLLNGLARLPERTAQVLRMLFGFEGECMRVKDVAEELQISTETVRLHRDRGIAMLREWLESRAAA